MLSYINIVFLNEWFIIFFGLFGVILGSFLNVCIDRLFYHSNNVSDHVIPQGWKALIIPVRSFCFACGTTISWYDNVPILSYVLLRGKCRHCLIAYGVRSLLIELCCLLLFVILGMLFVPNL